MGMGLTSSDLLSLPSSSPPSASLSVASLSLSEVEVVAASVVKDHWDGLGRLGSDVAGVAQRPEIPPGAVAVVELLLYGLEGREALPAVSGGPVLQLLPPSHADGPSSASPGEVGQPEKVVQHGADGVELVAVPLVVREPQPQLLGWHVARRRRSRKKPRRSGALAAAALCGPSGRACCRPRGPRSTSGARALRRPCPCTAASPRAPQRRFPSALGYLSIALRGAVALPRGLQIEAGHAPGTCTPCSRRCCWAWLPGSAPVCWPAPGSCGSSSSGRCAGSSTVCWMTPVPLGARCWRTW